MSQERAHPGRSHDMDRRSFLVGGGAAALTAWTARGAAAGTPDPDAVCDGIDRAGEAGRPLLVLLAPPRADQGRARGRGWSAYLQHATDAQLAPLCVAAFACASVPDVREATGAGADALPDGSLAAVVETAGASSLVRAVAPSEHDVADAIGDRLPHRPGEEVADDRERALRRFVDDVALRLAEALLPGDDALVVRVAQWREQHASGLAEGYLFEVHYDAVPRWDLLLPLGAMLLERARSDTARAEEWNALAAGAVRHALWQHAPEGSAWRYESSYCPSCGMGHVPPLSRHFLDIYTR